MSFLTDVEAMGFGQAFAQDFELGAAGVYDSLANAFNKAPSSVTAAATYASQTAANEGLGAADAQSLLTQSIQAEQDPSSAVGSTIAAPGHLAKKAADAAADAFTWTLALTIGGVLVATAAAVYVIVKVGPDLAKAAPVALA
jgi:hypothetical protein